MRLSPVVVVTLLLALPLGGCTTVGAALMVIADGSAASRYPLPEPRACAAIDQTPHVEPRGR